MFDYKNFFIRLLGLIIIIFIVFAIIYLGVYMLPFLIASIVAMTIEPVIKYVSKRSRISRKILVGILVFLVYGILGILTVLVCLRLIGESGRLINMLPDIYDKANLTFKNSFDKFKEAYNVLPDTISQRLYDVGVGLLGKVTDFTTGFLNSIFDFIKFIPTIMIYTCVTVLATYFIAADKNVLVSKFKDYLPDKWFDTLSSILNRTFKSLADYVKAQLILAGVTFVGSVVAFIVIGEQYPFTISLLMGFLDILPILGIGSAFVPWAIYSAATGNIAHCITLIIVYIILLSIRQVIEPKVVSSSLGIKPIVTLFSMFVGFKVFGFLGLIFGPIIAIILKDVFTIVLETGYIKKMFINKNEKAIRYFKKYD